MFNKIWNKNDTISEFNIELNRIEGYNKYIENWLKNYYNYSFETLNNKDNWTINDIPDINDFNRIKGNINVLLKQLDSNLSLLQQSQSLNQTLNSDKLNEIEIRLTSNMQTLGNAQFTYQLCGLSYCGDTLGLNIGG